MRLDGQALVTRVLPQPAVAAGTILLAVGALLAAWRAALPAHLVVLLPPAALALALAAAVVLAYRYPIHVGHQLKVALVTVVYALLAVLVPPPLAATAAGLGALAGELAHRRRSGAYPSDIVTEVGRRVLTVLPGALVAHAGGPGLPAPAALLGTVLTLAALDALSVPLVLAPVNGDRPWHALRVTARATWRAEAVQYAVALVGAGCALIYPWTLPLLLAPAALVYTACKALHEMGDATRQLLEGLADAVDLRDPYTGGHSRRVTEYSAVILGEMGLHGPEVELILAAARVHDLGKIGVPDAVLNKPGRLTAEERATMEEHPARGAVLLTRYRDFARGVALVRHHHESWDGAGYPDHLAGADIPFGARVIAVADSFDAMTSDRPCRAGMAVAQAMAILREGRGRQWEAPLVDALLRSAPVRELAARRAESLPEAPPTAEAAA